VKAKLRDDRQEAVGPNDVWAMDFVHDQLATGRNKGADGGRLLFTLLAGARCQFSYRGEDVVTTLERVCSRIGYSKTIRVDQSSEFISRDLNPMGVPTRYDARLLATGQTDGYAVIEAFNARLRAEGLNAHWFLSLADAAQTLGLAWRLQRAAATRRDWEQGPGRAYEIGTRSQPVLLIKAGKL
jgi:putative transposase